MSEATYRKKPHAQHEISQSVFEEKEATKQVYGPPPEGSVKDKEYERRAKNRLLRRPEVEARTGLSRSTLYSWMKDGRFPKPVRLGERIVAWRESDVTEWLDSRETRVA